MTRVEEADDIVREIPLGLDLVREICPVCRVECRPGDPLPHKTDCFRNPVTSGCESLLSLLRKNGFSFIHSGSSISIHSSKDLLISEADRLLSILVENKSKSKVSAVYDPKSGAATISIDSAANL